MNIVDFFFEALNSNNLKSIHVYWTAYDGYVKSITLELINDLNLTIYANEHEVLQNYNDYGINDDGTGKFEDVIKNLNAKKKTIIKLFKERKIQLKVFAEKVPIYGKEDIIYALYSNAVFKLKINKSLKKPINRDVNLDINIENNYIQGKLYDVRIEGVEICWIEDCANEVMSIALEIEME